MILLSTVIDISLRSVIDGIARKRYFFNVFGASTNDEENSSNSRDLQKREDRTGENELHCFIKLLFLGIFSPSSIQLMSGLQVKV